MSLKLYLLFLAMATATVFSPGPGVMLTLNNAMRLGWRASLPGILGIAAGALVVASISATGLGLLLASSALAFSIIKLVGATYLVYLGVKLWRSPGLSWQDAAAATPPSARRRFAEGLALQFTNPKAIFFFISVLPQFVDARAAHGPQFALLVCSYAGLVVLIHSGYAITAQRARGWLRSQRTGRALNRVGAITFMGFGAAMAAAKA